MVERYRNPGRSDCRDCRTVRGGVMKDVIPPAKTPETAGAKRVADLLKLRDALAAATGPARELDVAIAQTIWPQLTQYQTYCVGDDEPLFFADPFYKQPCPHFTASI